MLMDVEDAAIREDLAPADVARRYETAGAAARAEVVIRGRLDLDLRAARGRERRQREPGPAGGECEPHRDLSSRVESEESLVDRPHET